MQAMLEIILLNIFIFSKILKFLEVIVLKTILSSTNCLNKSFSAMWISGDSYIGIFLLVAL